MIKITLLLSFLQISKISLINEYFLLISNKVNDNNGIIFVIFLYSNFRENVFPKMRVYTRL